MVDYFLKLFVWKFIMYIDNSFISDKQLYVELFVYRQSRVSLHINRLSELA